jgi:hypothetical protein
LVEITEWMTSTDPEQPSIYVLDGIAGIGKSTIAQTLAKHSAEFGYLGASFFFSKTDSERKAAGLFFSTLACQLCYYDEEFAQRIGAALEHTPGASLKTLGQQLDHLLVQPLYGMLRSRPTLLVIDAMDECEETDATQVLALLATEVKNLPNFKIFITTRPEPYLRTFEHQGPHHRHFHFHEIETHVVEADIHLYFSHKLSKQQIQKALPDLEGDWEPTLAELNQLVQIVGKLFIVASTAIRFILDKHMADPEIQMIKLINAFEGGTNLNAMAGLDRMYLNILQSAVPLGSVHEIVVRFQKVVGTIVILERPLALESLALFLGMKVGTLKTTLAYLHSIIVPGSNEQAPQVYHKSFPDFITDKSRCTNAQLYVSPEEQHAQVAGHCFKVMIQGLHKNMLGLHGQQIYCSNNEILRLKEIKFPEELVYACMYWATHLSKAGDKGKEDLIKQLHTFTFTHLLHWMELLSLVGKLDVANPALIFAQRYVVSGS